MTEKELIVGEIYVFKWPKGRVIVLHENNRIRHFINSSNSYYYSTCCDYPGNSDNCYRPATQEEKDLLLSHMKPIDRLEYTPLKYCYEIY